MVYFRRAAAEGLLAELGKVGFLSQHFLVDFLVDQEEGFFILHPTCQFKSDLFFEALDPIAVDFVEVLFVQAGALAIVHFVCSF